MHTNLNLYDHSKTSPTLRGAGLLTGSGSPCCKSWPPLPELELEEDESIILPPQLLILVQISTFDLSPFCRRDHYLTIRVYIALCACASASAGQHALYNDAEMLKDNAAQKAKMIHTGFKIVFFFWSFVVVFSSLIVSNIKVLLSP